MTNLDRQGMWFVRDRLGREIPGVVHLPLCPVCNEGMLGPHDHRPADLKLILAELRRVQVEQAPMRALELEPAGEHLTLRELARYAKRSTKWLLARTKDSVDSLPCERPTAGKLTFRRATYDQWIERKRAREDISVSGVVDEILHEIKGEKTCLLSRICG